MEVVELVVGDVELGPAASLSRSAQASAAAPQVDADRAHLLEPPRTLGVRRPASPAAARWAMCSARSPLRSSSGTTRSTDTR